MNSGPLRISDFGIECRTERQRFANPSGEAWQPQKSKRPHQIKIRKISGLKIFGWSDFVPLESE
jgi:hypothetical protein